MEKSEKEKMLSGEIYDCGDKELLARWHKAKTPCNNYIIILHRQMLSHKPIFWTNCSDRAGRMFGLLLPFS
jgi:hypothetical protein